MRRTDGYTNACWKARHLLSFDVDRCQHDARLLDAIIRGESM